MRHPTLLLVALALAMPGLVQARDTRDVILDPSATQRGIGWLQEPTNKIWWVLNVGG